MPQMTPGQARAIDPVLTTVAQGYQNNEYVASSLFPRVNVNKRGGRIITFGKEDFMLYATQRAPGTNRKRVQFGYSGDPYALLDYDLEGMLPLENQEEAIGADGPGIDLSVMTVQKTQNIMELRLEKASADLARNAANYSASNKTALSGTSRWSDYGGTSNPIKDVEAAKEVVRKSTGKRPNTITMGAQVFAALKQHPVIVERIKYTGRDVATVELLASLFDVARVFVGDAVFANDAGAFSDVWGNDLVVAYTELGTMRDGGLPSYGYTYNLAGYPLVEEPYDERNANSWIYPVKRVEAPVIAGALAGFLFSSAVV